MKAYSLVIVFFFMLGCEKKKPKESPDVNLAPVHRVDLSQDQGKKTPIETFKNKTLKSEDSDSKKTLSEKNEVVSIPFPAEIPLLKAIPEIAPELIWMDGSKTGLQEHPGELISDNDGLYWGESSYTGVTYHYENAAMVYPDQARGHPALFGRKLLDGVTRFDGWNDVVGVHAEPLKIVFEFHQKVKIKEIDFVSWETGLNADVEVRDKSEDPWRKIETRVYPKKEGQDFYRFRLAAEQEAQEIRLTVDGGERTILTELFIWGKANHLQGKLKGVPPQKGCSVRERIRPIEISNTPLIDGVIDENESKHATEITFKNQGIQGAVDDQTKAWIAYDPKGFIFLTVECEEPEMGARFVTDPKGRGRWEDDRVEVFINAGAADQERYYHLGVNAAGKQLKDWSRVIDPTSDGKPFYFESAIQDGNGKWIAEFKIPIHQILIGGTHLNQEWSLLVARARKTKHEEKIEEKISTWPGVAGESIAASGGFGIMEVGVENLAQDLKYESFQGAPLTRFNETQFNQWKKTIELSAALKTIWIPVDGFKFEINKPFFPTKEECSKKISLQMVRNEIEGTALVLMNPSLTEEFQGKVTIEKPVRAEMTQREDVPVEDLRVDLHVGGTIWTQAKGVDIRPLFEAGNLLGKMQGAKYLTNGELIQDFPKVRIPAGGSLYFWARFESHGAQPGKYKTRINVEGSDAFEIDVEVGPVAVPEMNNHWLRSFGTAMDSWPFRKSDYFYQVGRIKAQNGVNVSESTIFDQKNIRAYDENAPQYAENKMASGKHYFHVMGLPEKIMNEGYNAQIQPPLTDEYRLSIRSYMEEIIKGAQANHVKNEDWFIELWDEPGLKNIGLYGEISEYIKSFAPQVLIYCPPCFWGEKGFPSDDEIAPMLQGWSRSIDIWVPNQHLLSEIQFPKTRQMLLAGKQLIRSNYNHPPRGRRMAWNAVQQGLNSYSYYSDYRPNNDYRPSANPWNDFDLAGADYVLIYPASKGPVISRLSEEMRESFEDFKMLQLLKKNGKEKEINLLLEHFKDLPTEGESTTDFQFLRNQLMQFIKP